MSHSITPKTRIQDIPYRTLKSLADILDVEGDKDWKALIAAMPSNSYSMTQISNLDRVGRTCGGSSSMELLRDFANLLKTVGELITYLEAIDNQQALLLIKQKEPVTITLHPTSTVLQVGQDLVLECKATGFPCPSYQWYKGKNGQTREMLPTQMSRVLRLNSIQLSDCGDYYCIATNPINSAFTSVAKLEVIPQIAPLVDGRTGSSITPTVQSQHYEQMVYPYQDFKLKSNVRATYYEWYKNGYCLPGQNQDELVFKPFLFDDAGFYTCKAYINDVPAEPMTVRLVLPSHVHPAYSNFMRSPVSSLQYASGKVALIIANKDYPCFQDPSKKLVHPINDALTLKTKLEELKFAVICLINLNFNEMIHAIKMFCQILKATPDMYSLFYFCGHGFEEHGITYLLPLDMSPISSNDVRYMIQECATKFDVFLFDVCRESSPPNSIAATPLSSTDRPFKSGSECVIGYSTCPQSQAFEKRQDRNGIYMKHLAMHIKENISVEKLMQNVCEAVREEAAAHHLTSDMHPSYTSSTTKSFSLCDAILPTTGFESRDNDPVNICFDYHRLPSSRLLHFSSNIICELSFEELCSNICVIVIYVANYGDAKTCDARIVEIINQDIDVKSETSNIEKSVLSSIIGRSLPTSDSSSASSITSVRSSKTQRETEIGALQRLKDTFTVRVRMTYITADNERRDEILEETYNSMHFGIVSFFRS